VSGCCGSCKEILCQAKEEKMFANFVTALRSHSSVDEGRVTLCCWVTAGSKEDNGNTMYRNPSICSPKDVTLVKTFILQRSAIKI